MPEKDAGSIKATAKIEAGDFDAGLKKMMNEIDDVEVKGKSLNVTMVAAGNILADMAGKAVGLGTSLLDAISKPLVASPQFAQFMSKMDRSFRRLSRILGQEFDPTMDKAASKFDQFINVLLKNEAFSTAMTNMKTRVDEFLDSIDAQDMEDFATALGKITDTTITLIFDIAGTAWDILAGTDKSKGMVQVIKDLKTALDAIGKTVISTLQIDAKFPDIPEDFGTRAAMVLALVGAGLALGPLGLPLHAAAAFIVGQTISETTGSPTDQDFQSFAGATGGLGGMLAANIAVRQNNPNIPAPNQPLISSLPIMLTIQNANVTFAGADFKNIPTGRIFEG